MCWIDGLEDEALAANEEQSLNPRTHIEQLRNIYTPAPRSSCSDLASTDTHTPAFMLTHACISKYFKGVSLDLHVSVQLSLDSE